MKHRSRAYTDLMREIPCQADFDHDCTGRWVTETGKYLTVPAHTNDLMFGRGASHKADDIFVASVCPPAHDMIDGRAGGWDKETKRYAWLRAYIGTQRWVWINGLVRLA